MSPEFTPETDVQRFVDRHYGTDDPEGLRTGEARRQYLERWARTMADSDLTLSLNDDPGDTARVRMDEYQPEIEIPSWEVPQPATQYAREAYDVLLQRMLTLHEVGHVLYTDEPTVNEALEHVDQAYRDEFHTVWNALEDAAIEEQLRRTFDIDEELAVMNANYMTKGLDTPAEYGFFDAVVQALLDLGVYDTGRLNSIVDRDDQQVEFASDADATRFEEVLPELRDAVSDVVSEPDPVERTRRIYECWEVIEDVLPESDVERTGQEPSGKPDDSTGSGPGRQAPDLGQDTGQTSTDGDRSQQGSTTNGTDRQDNTDGPEQSGSETGSSSGKNGDSNTEDDEGSGRPDARSDDSGRADDIDGDTTSVDDDTPARESSDRTRDDPTDGDTGTATDSSSQRTGSSDARGDMPNSGGDPGSQADAHREGRETPSEIPGSAATDSDGTRSSESGDGPEAEPGPDTERDPGPDDDTDVAPTHPGRDQNVDDLNARHDERLESEYRSIANRNSGSSEEDTDEVERELSDLSEALEGLDDETVGTPRLDVPTDAGAPSRPDVWHDVRQQGRRLSRILDQRLQQERRSSWRRRTRRGRIDSRSIPSLYRGDTRIFRRRERPEEKDYSAVVILDRSGSMGNVIRRAENATVAFVKGLEDLDIDVTVIDFLADDCRLVKPSSVDVETSLDTLLTGEYDGTTPLTEALQFAKARVQSCDHPFVIVVTDGEPDYETRFRQELETTKFPVYGVYLHFEANSRNDIDEVVRTGSRNFDRCRVVIDGSRLEAELKALCRDVLL